MCISHSDVTKTRTALLYDCDSYYNIYTSPLSSKDANMDYFKNLKSKITPQKTQPTHAEQLAKFRKSWNYIEVSGGDSIFN